MTTPYYYPSSYQPIYNPYQQQLLQQTQNSQQTMTPPTIHADIVQVDNEQSAINYPVGAGESQMMIARDDSAIFVKSALQNGQYKFDVFTKRPPEPDKPKFDPSEYIKRDEIEGIIDSILANRSPGKTKKGTAES